MQLTNTIKKLTKLGFEVENLKKYDGTDTNQYVAYQKDSKYLIEFINQSGVVTFYQVRRNNDHDDAYTDYHAGVYTHSFNGAVLMATNR